MQKEDINLSKKSWNELLSYDELTISLNGGNSFPGFIEVDDIRFPPTYKRQVYLIIFLERK